MRLFRAFVGKVYCYPLNHAGSGDNGHLFFQARGDGLYPLIKDGDILRVQDPTLSGLQAGDLTVLERPTGEFTVDFVVGTGWATQKTSVRTERLVGRIMAIERDGRTKKVDDRFTRISHLIYVSARPLTRLVLIVRKMLSLLHPKFFVKDPGSSLRSVVEKYHDAKEVLYYSQRAFAGLDGEEQHLSNQFMKRRGRVLNIGCGAGREAFALAEAGFEVVGIDVAPPMIAEAKRHAQTSGIPIQFDVKDATTLDYPPKSFDYMWISAAVYSHIPSRQLRIQTLKKINDLLTPNGMLFFSVEYQGNSLLSRASLHGAFRRLAKSFLKKRLHAEPGDVLVPHVSPVGTPSKLCFFHLFKDAGEVKEELSSANLDGFEDQKSGYWIVRPVKAANNRGTILNEVAG